MHKLIAIFGIVLLIAGVYFHHLALTFPYIRYFNSYNTLGDLLIIAGYAALLMAAYVFSKRDLG